MSRGNIEIIKQLTKCLQKNTIQTTNDTFRIQLEDSTYAVVGYIKNGSTYNLVETTIPECYQGYGLGKLLAERVFDHLIKDQRKIRLTCTFLKKFYQENEHKYKKYVVGYEDML